MGSEEKGSTSSNSENRIGKEKNDKTQYNKTINE
jgi:hypothetical protein